MMQQPQPDLEQDLTEKVIHMKPAVWSPPCELQGGMIVEVGRRELDIIFHLWHHAFPDGFEEHLADAVERVMNAPERFQASFTPDLAAIWNPGRNELVAGPVEFVRKMTPRGQQRVVRSWALRAVGYAPVEEAHLKLTTELIDAINEIFLS